MAFRWVDAALIGLIGLFILNQYPAWGSNASERASVAIDFQIGYLTVAGLALVIGLVLYVWGSHTGRLDREIPLALCVLGGGLYVHYSLMVVVQHEVGVRYAQVAAPVVAILVLALVLSARLSDREDEAAVQ